MISRFILPALARIGLAAALLAPLTMPSHAEVLTIGGTGADLETIRVLADAFERANATVNVDVLPSLGSSGGVKAVLAGVIDLGLTSRPLKKNERKAGAREIAYAKLLTAFATRRGMAEMNFTVSEVIGIYEGARTTWPDGTPIRLIVRSEAESSAQLVMARIPGMDVAYRRAIDRTGVLLAHTDQENARMIRREKGSLGTISLSAILLDETNSLMALSLGGATPTVEAARDDSYPLSSTLYFVTGTQAGELARSFISFVASAEGRAILERSGHLLNLPDAK